MASHRTPGPPRRLLAVIGSALVVLLAVVGVAVAKGHSSGGATTSASGSTPSPTASSASPSGSASSPSASSAGSSPSSTSSSASGSVDGKALAAWARCSDQLKAGSDLLSKTDKAAASWKTHYEAQILYDAGKISLAKTRQMWSTSKAAGFGEVKAYAASSNRYAKTGKPCGALPLVVPSTQVATAKTCAAKADAQGAAIRSGSVVAGAWADHMHMMVSTPNHGTPQYLRMWHGMVDTAPAQRAQYDKAVTAYQKTPGCSAPSA